MLSIPNIPYQPFPKIPRLNRDVIITEKIDGTNSSIYITDDLQLFAASKIKWITTEEDNHGFASWCLTNRQELLKLGPGLHRGEFFGLGINKNPHKLPDKQFALFNTKYLTDNEWNNRLPSCCIVVPLLYTGLFDTKIIKNILYYLTINGSKINGKAEGIIIYHTASGQGFKVTCENDDKPKGLSEDK